jgi:putative SbcD/Mre11-related phosphoesterase
MLKEFEFERVPRLTEEHGDSGTYSLAPVGDSPSLLLQGEGERVLVVGDLHIGWEITLAQQGIHVPSQTGKLADRLIDIISKSNPTRIVFLGDVKHTVARAELEEWRDVPEFFERIVPLVSDIQIIQGNHDGNIEPMTPRQVKILPPNGIALWGRYGLFHGHAWPAPELLGCESLIQGHLHPVVAFTDALGYRITRPVWVRAPCNGPKLARVILKESKSRNIKNIQDRVTERFGVELKVSHCLFAPPFNDFLGGRPINLKERSRSRWTRIDRFGPLLRGGIVNMNEAEVQLLDGTYLGTVKQLRAFA